MSGRVKKPSQVLSSSSEHLRRSYPERGMGGLRTIAGGELCGSWSDNNIMNNDTTQKSNLDKVVKVSIIVAILLVAFSVTYYFVIRPIQKERLLQRCLTDLEFRKNLNLPQTHSSPKSSCYNRF